jgi:sugar phosphate isomerase/epimerase
MPLKVGISTGLYGIARSEDLGTVVRKLGYGLTRGVAAIEISEDVPHEITETEGRELRYIAKKQGLELLLHGSLTVPMCIPERGEWRDADDHLKKSVRSAVYAGCSYVNFHSSLREWLELMTYAGRKLTMTFCDHEGNFIDKILKKSEKLRKWFVEKRWDDFFRDILTTEEIEKAHTEASIEVSEWRKREELKKLRALNLPDEVIEYIQVRGTIPPTLPPSITKRIDNALEEVRRIASEKSAEISRDKIKEKISDKLSKGEKWRNEELRAVVGVLDGYHIMAHYLFYEKDPIWAAMVEQYKDVIKKYKLDYSKFYWLDEAWEEAEKKNDKEFKEFFYAVCGAKFLEGHMKKLFEWMNKELIKKELKNNPELQEIARKLKIALEIPDSRDPSVAGMYILWHPKQLYAAIKTIRKTLKTDRIWILIDFEHIATQGLDVLKTMEEVTNKNPDFGSYVLSVHSNKPNPLHSHIPIEIGDIDIYTLEWYLRRSGMGKTYTAYLIFERGGGEDPFKRAVEALKIIARYLEQDIPPENLPPEFFGVKGLTAGSFKRQLEIIRDHFHEPLKDLLQMPEEEWTMLSQAAIRAGRKPEAWKKGELR